MAQPGATNMNFSIHLKELKGYNMATGVIKVPQIK